MNEFSSDEWKVLCKSKLKLTWLKPTKQKQEAGWMEREADCNNQILSIPGILARCSQLHLQNPANQGHARKQTQQQTEGNTHSRPCENSRAVTVRYSNIQLPSVVFKPRVWRFPKQMHEWTCIECHANGNNKHSDKVVVIFKLCDAQVEGSEYGIFCYLWM